MARGKKIEGNCYICGDNGPLTFEHVPPRAAFNDRPIIRGKFEDAINLGPEPLIKGKKEQRGLGDYTLCGRCNTTTGDWYASDFIEWTFQGYQLLDCSEGVLTLAYPFQIFPLRVIKQIVTMFFSVNGPTFRESHPDLVRFVLNKERKYLDPKISIYTYLMSEGSAIREMGITGTGIFKEDKMIQTSVLSELSFPPLGYVMTFGTNPPDERLVEISHFSRYDYNDWRIMFLKIPALPVHMHIPGDYRTKKEIVEDYLKNIELESK